MRQLIYSPKAAGDLDEIYDYTEAKWGFQQAEDYSFDLRDCCRSLSVGMKSGRPADPDAVISSFAAAPTSSSTRPTSAPS